MSAAGIDGSSIVVPGSVSNLGPGFDALSVAVTVYLRLSILEIRPDAPGRLDMEFAGGAPPGENRVESGFRAAERHFGDAAPGLRVRVESDIPMRAGLGSSAAATVAGLKLYERVTTPRDPGDLLALATTIEGHPDNAAAALHGGLTTSCQLDDGRVLTSAWPFPDELRLIVATPGAELATSFARQVLPDQLPLRDAVFNLQRALLLVRALETGQFDWVREALRDRWHQPARAAHVPGLAAALALDHPAVLGACLSGAGPSIAVLALATRQDEAAAALREIYEGASLPYTIRLLQAHPPVAPLGTDA